MLKLATSSILLPECKRKVLQFTAQRKLLKTILSASNRFKQNVFWFAKTMYTNNKMYTFGFCVMKWESLHGHSRQHCYLIQHLITSAEMLFWLWATEHTVTQFAFAVSLTAFFPDGSTANVVSTVGSACNILEGGEELRIFCQLSFQLAPYNAAL